MRLQWTMEKNKHFTVVPILKLDLSDKTNLQIIESMIQSGKLLAVTMAPPCGTASRARDRRIKSPNKPDPKPLRSESHPEGLPNLTGSNHERVQLANLIYEHLMILCELCLQLKVPFIVENPKRSYFWLTSWVKKILKQQGIKIID